MQSPLYFTCLVVPVMEEIVFRALLHKPIKWIVKKLVPEKTDQLNLDLGSDKILPIERSVIITSIVSGIIFGLLHGFTFERNLKIACSGAIYGIMYEKMGLISSISAHAIFNCAACCLFFSEIKIIEHIARSRGIKI